MGERILGGLLSGLGRGVEAFQETKRRERENEFDQRLAELQFKQLGLKLEEAEFDRDKRVALGTAEEQATAEKEFEERMRKIDDDARKLDEQLTNARIRREEAQAEFTEARTGLLGQAPLDDKTKELVDSLKSTRKTLDSELDVLIEAGATEEQISTKQSEIQGINDEILSIESAARQGLIGGGQFPTEVRTTIADLIGRGQQPTTPSAPRQAPRLFGRGEPEKRPQVPLLLDEPTDILRRAVIEPTSNIAFKAPITALERFFKGRDPFAKQFQFTGTDTKVQPGNLTPQQVQQALQSGIIEEIPLKSISEQTGPVPFFGAPRPR